MIREDKGDKYLSIVEIFVVVISLALLSTLLLPSHLGATGPGIRMLAAWHLGFPLAFISGLPFLCIAIIDIIFFRLTLGLPLLRLASAAILANLTFILYVFVMVYSHIDLEYIIFYILGNFALAGLLIRLCGQLNLYPGRNFQRRNIIILIGFVCVAFIQILAVAQFPDRTTDVALEPSWARYGLMFTLIAIGFITALIIRSTIIVDFCKIDSPKFARLMVLNQTLNWVVCGLIVYQNY